MPSARVRLTIFAGAIIHRKWKQLDPGACTIATQQKPDSWQERLEAWLTVCAEASSRTEELACLRFLVAHLANAPRTVRGFLDATEITSRTEQLLDHGAVESAVAELLHDAPHGFMMSRAVAGPTICTLVIPGGDQEFSFESRSESMARIGAAAKAMIMLASSNIEAPISRNQCLH